MDLLTLATQVHLRVELGVVLLEELLLVNTQLLRILFTLGDGDFGCFGVEDAFEAEPVGLAGQGLAFEGVSLAPLLEQRLVEPLRVTLLVFE